MPEFAFAIPNTNNSVVRPVVTDIVYKLLPIFGINKDENDIVFNQDNVMPILNNTQAGSGLDIGKLNTNTRSRIEVDIEEAPYSPLAQIQTTYSRGQPKQFNDPINGISLVTAYETNQITLKLKKRFNGIESAREFANIVSRKLTQGENQIPLVLTYSYQIPKSVIYRLEVLWGTKQKIRPDDETFLEWVGKSFTTKKTNMTNQAYNKDVNIWTIRETQAFAQVFIDYQEVPTMEIEAEDATATMELSFKVIYDKPITMTMRYPIMLHQTMIPKELRNVRLLGAYNHEMNGSYSDNGFLKLSYLTSSLDPTRFYKIPEDDDFVMYRYNKKIKTLLSVLISVDPDKPREIVNLNDIEYLTNVDGLIEYMTDIGNDIFYDTGSALFIEMYTNESRYTMSDLQILGNGEIYTSTVLSYLRIHRLFFRINLDLARIKPSAMVHLCKHGKVCLAILASIYPPIKNSKYFPKLTPDGTVNINDFYTCIMQIPSTSKNLLNGVELNYKRGAYGSR